MDVITYCNTANIRRAACTGDGAEPVPIWRARGPVDRRAGPPPKAITPQRHRARKRLTWSALFLPTLFLPTLFLSAIATPAIPTTTIGSLQAVGLPVPALWQFRYWYC